ncbi:MAG TPA: TrpB-like pyridoxal phosphate-dependent enzyme [Fimbriimonas sp.]
MQRQFILQQSDIPTEWYNVVADMPNPPEPPIHPGTKQPAGPDDLKAIFPDEIIEQEVSGQRWIAIPDEVRECMGQWRPSPLYRAVRLEEALGTPARIYYKFEGTSPVGSHKLNTALAQAYYNKRAGVTRVATETGAGQWGCSMALAASYFGLECTVYMVKVSYHQKPYRRSMMHAYGAKIYASPSQHTAFGRKTHAEDPEGPGSLGIAISEAIEDTVTHEGVKYTLGSVTNHVCLHQTIIGLESKKQMAIAGDYPDVVIGCTGGGSNFAGLAFPFLADKFAGKEVRLLGVEPASCPSLTQGEYRYDFGDTAMMTPLFKMYTLGHDFIPPGIHAGGLRYHGMSPLVSQLKHEGFIEAVAYDQVPVFEAAVQFARAEGIIPAPESSHAIKGAIEEALKAKEEGKERVILFNLSGHGLLDLGAYDSYFAGKLQ